MPTYLIEGKKVQTEAPLSEAEIDEIGASIKGSSRPAPPPGMDSWMVPPEVQAERDRKALEVRGMNPNDPQDVKEIYKLKPSASPSAKPVPKAISPKVEQAVQTAVKEQTFVNNIKQGFGNFAGMLGGASTQLSTFRQGLVQLASAISGVGGQSLEDLGFTSPEEGMKAFKEGYEKYQSQANKLTGAYPTPEPTDILGQMYEAAVGSLGDPTSALSFGAKPALTIGAKVLRTIGAEATSATVSGGSVLGGETGKRIEKGVFGTSGTTGQVIGSLAGVPAASATLPVVNQASKAVKGAKLYLNNSDVELVEKAETYKVVNNLLDNITREQGISNIDDFVSQWNDISSKITGKKTPLLVALSDNPSVKAAFVSVVKNDPDFRSVVQSELKTISDSIENRANLLVGGRYTPLTNKEVVKLDVAEKRLENLDKAIQNFSNTISPTQSAEQRGQIITDLVAKKEKAAREAVSPLYDKVIEEGVKDGVKLGSEETGKLYQFVKQNNLEDIFGKGTALENKVMSVIRPEIKEQQVEKTVIDAVGMRRKTTVKKNVEVFPEIDAKNIDSLKRAINDAKRGNLSNEQRRKLNQFEEVFDGVRETLPAKFNEGLRAADRTFYEKVGVPFNQATIDSIDSKSFAEQVAPVISSSSSKTREFLSAVGKKEGQPIVRNAVVSEIYSKFVDPVSGQLKTQGLAAYMKERKDVINQVDGLEAELRGFVTDYGSLTAKRKLIDEAYNKKQGELAKTWLVKSGFEPNYSQTATEILNNPSKATKLLDEMKNFSPETAKAVMNNLRREIIAKGIDSPEGVYFFTNPVNKPVIDKMFGKQYQQNIQKLLKLSDAVQRVDPSKVSESFSTQQLDSVGKFLSSIGAPGLSLPFVTSTIRDRISSVPQKAVRLLSKVNSTRLDQSIKEGVKEILLDPDGLNKFVTKYKDANIQKFANPVSVKELVGDIQSRMPLYMYQAEEGNVNNRMSTRPKAPVNPAFVPEIGSFQ